MCGGTYQLVWASPPCQGLSPRVRGNRRNGFQRPLPVGSIPACAGEPGLAALKDKDDEVYPRVCGGTRGRPAFTCRIRGLSPRVRGNLSLRRRGG